jgi:hypothetical protein
MVAGTSRTRTIVVSITTARPMPIPIALNGDARFITQREPHWNVTVLVPSELVTMLDVIGCEPYFTQ